MLAALAPPPPQPRIQAPVRDWQLWGRLVDGLGGDIEKLANIALSSSACSDGWNAGMDAMAYAPYVAGGAGGIGCVANAGLQFLDARTLR
jgi:hypothetical protein